VNRSVLAGQRIGILGANGQGKSTLVKTVAEALKATSGEIIRGKGLSIGYFSQQELDVLRPEDDPLQHMLRLVRETPTQLRPPANDCREQGCAISLAPSISAATWSSRRWQHERRRKSTAGVVHDCVAASQSAVAG
jgi:energy-coupling factor transporter ATP-binding protein EcfA2